MGKEGEEGEGRGGKGQGGEEKGRQENGLEGTPVCIFKFFLEQPMQSWASPEIITGPKARVVVAVNPVW